MMLYCLDPNGRSIPYAGLRTYGEGWAIPGEISQELANALIAQSPQWFSLTDPAKPAAKPAPKKEEAD